LAILSSEKAIIFPLIILMYEFSFGGFVNLKTNWKRISGFFMPFFFAGLYYASQIGSRLQSVRSLSAGSAGQALNPLTQVPIAVTSYLEGLFWPSYLTLYRSEMTFGQFNYLVRLAVLIAYIFLVLYMFKKNRLVFFFLSFFIISLLPTLTPLGISWIVAERYVYFGSTGIFFAFAYLLNYFYEKSGKNEMIIWLFAFILAVLMGRTIIRNSEWKSEDSLWTATSKTSPSSQNTHNNMGDVYARHKDYQNAILEFKKSIEINPKYADAWHNLALSYQNIGQVEEAIKTYKKAIALNPKLWQSRENLTVIYFNKGDFDKSENMLQKLITIKPDNPDYYLNLAIVNLKKGNSKNAKELLAKVLTLDPKNQKAKDLLKTIK
jgi:tetratricopeptide (TPR) repeat protein